MKDLENKSLRVGAAAVICAVIFRLLAGGIWEKAVAFMTRPETAAFILYMETGRLVRPAQLQVSTEPSLPPETVESTTASTAPPETLPQEQLQAVFSPEEAQCVEVNSVCGYSVDIQSLLLQDLHWDLSQEAPTVLILHTHGSESYTPTEDYTESSQYRTLDTRYNVVSVGAYLGKLLEEGGIRVIHDTTLHDDPSYNDAYQQSREAARDYLEEYPSLCLILDIHRDAAEDSQGRQVAKTVSTGGRDIAQLMLVVGTDAGGLIHPNWRENMALAVKLHTQLEKNFPGICRPISFRSQRFNQDLSPGALIVEIGTAGNTRQEALLAAEVLAKSILDLSHGSVGAVTAGSTS